MKRMAVPGASTMASVERLAGNLLQCARGRAGMTQRQLADAAGVACASPTVDSATHGQRLTAAADFAGAVR